MQIFDKLVRDCHETLHLFTEPFLRAIGALLESGDPELQVRGCTSFVKYTDIETEGSYHRHHAFFVNHFSVMCYKEEERVCCAGLRALMGVTRRMVSTPPPPPSLTVAN